MIGIKTSNAAAAIVGTLPRNAKIAHYKVWSPGVSASSPNPLKSYVEVSWGRTHQQTHVANRAVFCTWVSPKMLFKNRNPARRLLCAMPTCGIVQVVGNVRPYQCV